jgi:hypothetical protein
MPKTRRKLKLNEILEMRKYFWNRLNSLDPHAIASQARARLVLMLIEDYLELKSSRKTRVMDGSSVQELLEDIA